MKPSHIEHIGIAVKNLEEAISFFEHVIGVSCYAIEEVEEQKVKTAFFKIGDTKIELLESTDPEGPVGKFIEKKGEGIHHIAFAVENLAQKLQLSYIETSAKTGENIEDAFKMLALQMIQKYVVTQEI